MYNRNVVVNTLLHLKEKDICVGGIDIIKKIFNINFNTKEELILVSLILYPIRALLLKNFSI